MACTIKVKDHERLAEVAGIGRMDIAAEAIDAGLLTFSRPQKPQLPIQCNQSCGQRQWTLYRQEFKSNSMNMSSRMKTCQDTILRIDRCSTLYLPGTTLPSRIDGLKLLIAGTSAWRHVTFSSG